MFKQTRLIQGITFYVGPEMKKEDNTPPRPVLFLSKLTKLLERGICHPQKIVSIFFTRLPHRRCGVTFLSAYFVPDFLLLLLRLLLNKHSKPRLPLMKSYFGWFFFVSRNTGLNILTKIDEIDMSISSFRPQSRKNEISDIFPWQKCVIQIEMSNSRISYT